MTAEVVLWRLDDRGERSPIPVRTFNCELGTMLCWEANTPLLEYWIPQGHRIIFLVDGHEVLRLGSDEHRTCLSRFALRVARPIPCGCGVNRDPSDPRVRSHASVDGVPHRRNMMTDGTLPPITRACRNCGAWYTAFLAGQVQEDT